MENDDIIKILFSLLLGSIIGLEREYRSKPAGFRTLTVICVGSALFTIMSIKIGAPSNADRIASYILVGVGFIGSGVIFKDGLKISGLTTAATIWITAALGMAAGNGDFLLAGVVLFITYVVLELLARVEPLIERFNSSKVFVISFKADPDLLDHMESEFRKICPQVRRTAMRKSEENITCTYEVDGGNKKYEALLGFLLSNEAIVSFET